MDNEGINSLRARTRGKSSTDINGGEHCQPLYCGCLQRMLITDIIEISLIIRVRVFVDLGTFSNWLACIVGVHLKFNSQLIILFIKLLK